MWKQFFIIFLLMPSLIFAQATNPSDTLRIGQASSAADKGFIFNTNDGPSNPKLVVDKTTKALKFDQNTFQIGTGSAADKTISFAGVSKSFKYNNATGEFELDDDLQVTGEVQTNILRSRTGSEIAAESSVRMKQPMYLGTGDVQIRESGGFAEFSVDGAVFKKFGSGSGGASGGVNAIASNPGFEDNVTTGWAVVGGSVTSQTYTSGLESNTKFSRFVASAGAQTYCTSVVPQPDFISGGCMADIRYNQGSGSFTYRAYSGGTVLASGTFNAVTSWQKAPTLTFACPAAAASIKFCVESSGTGTIDLDDVYLGSNKGIIPSSSLNSMSARITSAGSVTSSDGEWSKYVSSVADTGIGGTTITFVAGKFTVIPATLATVQTAGSTAKFCAIDTPTTSSVVIYCSNDEGSQFDGNINVVITKQGADAVSFSEAVSPETAEWYFSGNIGGATVSGGTVNQSSYVELTNAALDLVINPQSTGGATAKIACSGTNPPTGLTCAAGSESLGVVPNFPRAGKVRVCGAWGQYVDLDVNFTPQWTKTSTNAQTIIEEGGERPGWTVAASDNEGSQAPTRLCGVFTVSQGENQALRLMYEQTSSGNGADLQLDRAASSGQRDMAISVEYIDQQMAKPVLIPALVLHQIGWRNIALCNPAVTAASYTTMNDTDCTFAASNLNIGSPVTPTVTGDISLKVGSIPAGRYRVSVGGILYTNSVSLNRCLWRLTDGTNIISAWVDAAGAGTSQAGPGFSRIIEYTSTQTNLEWKLQVNQTYGSGGCQAIANSADSEVFLNIQQIN